VEDPVLKGRCPASKCALNGAKVIDRLKPGNNAGRAPVNLLHHGHLSVLLHQVTLVNAEQIDPEQPLRRPAKISKHTVDLRRAVKPLALHQDIAVVNLSKVDPCIQDAVVVSR